MSPADQQENHAPTPLDAEREQLRKVGYSEAEISQILIARAVNNTQQSAGAVGQGVMSNTLSSIVAVASHARLLIPTFRKDVATMFDGAAAASSRAGAAASLVVKAVVVLVLGFAAWQEWNQHIISATAIADAQVRKTRAEECSARSKAILDTVPMNKLGEAYGQLEKDCDPTYAQRTAACTAKFKAILDLVSTSSTDEIKAKIEAHKKECAITDADREAAKAKFAALDEEKKQRIAAVTTIMLDTAKAKEAFEAGRYDEAFKVARANASAAQAFEIQTSGKAGDLTASGLSRLSWYALFARQYATALDAAERSIKLKPDDLEPETNRAHALMFLGRATEAKTIYVAHKGEPLNGKKWEEVIADDFAQLRKAGITHPFMDEAEAALKPRVASPPTRCPDGKPLCV
jgi:hypothetical protein